MPSRFQFPAVTHLTAGAQGVPGKRTFYLEIGQGDEWIRTWLEKAMLQALAEAIDRVLAELAGKTFLPQSTEKELKKATPRSGKPSAEFRAGRLTMGYNERTGQLVLVIHEEGVPENSPPTVECNATQEQVRALSGQIKAAVAAGRPSCPLCGGPVDPSGHICPKRNGHRVSQG